MNAGLGRTYRYFTGTPLYPFGWGLSYTTFNLSWAAPPTPGTPTVFSVSVTNTGSVAGDEVVLAFFSTNDIPANEPASAIIRQLFDFQRVSLAPGQSTVIDFSVDPTTNFQLYDNEGNQVIFPGTYTVQFTNGVDQSLTYDVNVGGEKRILDTFV